MEEKLSPQEVLRYDRHLGLPELGLSGQLRLKQSRILVVGMGGLGSPASLYLAAAGVGHLGLLDFDRVELSNLQRQVIHNTANLGRPKTESAKAYLQSLNQDIEIQCFEAALSEDNASELVSQFDIVIDGSDNFSTRYLLNDACFFLKKPLVYGSVFRFQGQVSVFHPAAGGPCYRCLYPELPPAELTPNCAEGGVLGILPGVVGSLQATEAIKLATGLGRSLQGRLLNYDALRMEFREWKLSPAPNCPLCSDQATIHELKSYEQSCTAPSNLPSWTPDELRRAHQREENFRLIDVREPAEWESFNLQEFGAELVPLETLSSAAQEWERESSLVVYCRSGRRSLKAQEALLEAGFSRVINLEGGVLRWLEN